MSPPLGTIVLPLGRNSKYHTISLGYGRITDCGRFVPHSWRRFVNPKFVTVWGCKTCAQVRRRG